MRDQYDRFHERVRIEYGPKGRIAQLVMENSDMPISVFSSSMVDTMTEAVETVDGDIGCLILCGEDEFSAGADLRDVRNAPTEMRSAKIDAIAASSNRFIRALRSLSAPVIAAVTGVAAGGGLGFALACDLVMMHTDAMLDTAYARIGLTPDNATPFFLTMAVGPYRARELLFDPVRSPRVKRSISGWRPPPTIVPRTTSSPPCLRKPNR